MEYRKVGNSALEVSVVGLGCNNLGRAHTPTETQEGTDKVIKTAIDSGINFFDCADMYGKEPGLSETMLGKALANDRDKVIVATKFGLPVNGANGEHKDEPRGSASYIRKSVESSLKRLNTDYIDLYQFHTPDPKTDIEETLVELDKLVKEGKVRYIGNCNFAGWQIAEAHFTAQLEETEQFISVQNHYNLLDRRAELEVMPAAKQFGLGIFPYFPLANGLLTDKYRDPKERENTKNRLVHSKQEVLAVADWDQLEKYYKFCDDNNLSVTEATFSWLAAQKPIASVIAGGTTEEQIKANAKAVSWKPTESELAEIDKIFPAPDKIALF
ncbi:MAG: aldo/keto reductase [Micrococcaceae bacterium]